jgi:hypothetical protein
MRYAKSWSKRQTAGIMPAGTPGDTTMRRLLASLVLAFGSLGGSGGVLAQSNDGFHSMQVIPVAVDSASFSQRFIFRPYLLKPTTIQVRYYPAGGTSQTLPLDCPEFTIPTEPRPARTVYKSLRELCPALPSGPQFGLLYLRAGGGLPFAAYSRASNAAGSGFSIEAFPPHLFTNAPAIVDGVRRLAATASTPAFQTNCFIANLAELTPSAPPVATEIFYGVILLDGTQAGSSVWLAPGQMVRLLDVFAASGLAPGDADDAEFRFISNSPGPQVPLVGFCTVQDNSSFGADFRIAKPDQDWGCIGEEGCDYGMGDAHVMRQTTATSDTAVSGVGRLPFSLPAGPAHQNSHVLYFRHPDEIGCRLLSLPGYAPATPAYGLEMRLLFGDQVLAGGDNAVGFSGLYLGDKFDRGGTNQRYVLQVESNGQNEASARPYVLQCDSGSGHTRGDTILRDRAADDF